MQHQKGVALIITFFIMTIALAIVIGLGFIIYNEVKIYNNAGSSVAAYYAAETGIEKTLYYDRKITNGATRGLCYMLDNTNPNKCPDCTNISITGTDCGITTCTSCEIKYDSVYDDKSYSVDAKVYPDPTYSNVTNFTIDSKGFYKNTSRAIELNNPTTN